MISQRRRKPKLLIRSCKGLKIYPQWDEWMNAGHAVAGPHAPGMPCASRATLNLSGQGQQCLVLRSRQAPWVVSLLALRSSITCLESHTDPGLGKVFSFYWFKLLTLEQSASFITCFWLFFFFFFGPCLPSSMFLQYVVAISLHSLLLLLILNLAKVWQVSFDK